MIINWWIFAEAEMEQLDKFIELLGEITNQLLGLLVPLLC